MINKLSIILLGLYLVGFAVRAGTINAANLLFRGRNRGGSAAADGDTVVIPAGTPPPAWTSGIDG